MGHTKNMENLNKKEVKLLGILLSCNHNELIAQNYNPILVKMKHQSKLWAKRKRPLAGKITVVKTMLTSRLAYCMSCLLSPSPHYWKEVNNLLYTFIANVKTEKFTRKP